MKDDLRGDLLHDLLACPVERRHRPVDSHASWRKLWESEKISRKSPIDRSIFGGFLSDRLAWAFASGYQGAIRQLIPQLPQGSLAAICITESGGNHPRDIHTRLIPCDGGYRLKGRKQFVTGGEDADLLVVAACTGMVDGRNRIRMARVDRDDAGLSLSPMPPLPFVPEIRHCVARFDDLFVPAERLLPGDGYAGYIRPFRTIEDLHVTGAVIGFFVAAARRFGWPEAVLENLAVLIVTVRALAGRFPLSPATHIAMGGLLRQVDDLMADTATLQADTGSRFVRQWQRDKGVLNVAGRTRHHRLETARKHYRNPSLRDRGNAQDADGKP